MDSAGKSLSSLFDKKRNMKYTSFLIRENLKMFFVNLEIYGSVLPNINSDIYNYKLARIKSLNQLRQLVHDLDLLASEHSSLELGHLFNLLSIKLIIIKDMLSKILSIFQDKLRQTNKITPKPVKQ